MTGTRRVAVWDMDEVLANLRDVLCERLSPVFGVEADWRAWTDYSVLYRHFTREPQPFIDAMVSERVIEHCAPEPHAGEALADLAARGYRNVIVTARAWHPAAEAVSWEWLERHGMAASVERLIAVPPFASKTGAIASLGPVDLYVEDSAHHLDAAMGDGLVDRGVIVDRPWNAGWPGRARALRVSSLGTIAAEADARRGA